jgi:hypothetical protein
VYQLEGDPDYCDIVIIDTGYMAYELCFDFCLRKLKITDPRDEGWGSGWKLIEREFRNEQMKILNAGFGLGVTAHTEMKTLKTRQGVEYQKLCIQLGGQAGKFYNSFADIICHFQYDEKGKREIILRGDNLVEAGTRTKENFFFTDDTPIMTLPIDFTGEKDPAKEAYKVLVKAFNNQLDRKEEADNVEKTSRIRRSRRE